MTRWAAQTYNRAMQLRKGRSPAVEPEGISGMPSFNYRVPIVVSTLAALAIFVVIAVLAVISLGRFFNELERMSAGEGDIVFLVCLCAPFTVLLAGGAVYFLGAIIKGLRDMAAPVHYTRGSVADRKTPGGPRRTPWLHVDARYSGPDLQTASEVSDEQRAASADRSQILQPRFPSDEPGATQGVGYLPAHRLSDEAEVSIEPPGPSRPPLMFRVEALAQVKMEPGQEVLVAHSPYLQHVYYVSRLKDGEWESFRNKTLI